MQLRESLSNAYVRDGDSAAFTPGYLNNAAAVHAAVLTLDTGYHADAQSFFYDWLCDSSISHTDQGRACHEQSPSLGSTITVAGLAVIYANSVRNRPTFFQLKLGSPVLIDGAKSHLPLEKKADIQ